MKNIVIIAALLLAMTSCKKEDPKPTQAEIQAMSKAHKVM
jgi:hypothetical protein